ncbi:MAG: transcriptional repressor [Kiritimatiellae bacterium]|nr:transcriptional repressor [Kiritimatiellia bacterium]
MASFASLCRRAGIRATHQRMEIFRELAGTEEHPDVETIYRSVRRRIPEISLDTVYRTLRLLEEKGIISKVSHPGDRARFDANPDRHHHFICTKCGLVHDFYSEELNRFRPPGGMAAVGKVESVHVELRGICRACRR